MIRLGANINSLAAQRRLGESSRQLSMSYERLASGSRINRASDDAAGLAIASQLNSGARVFTQAVRNVNDALSAANTAEAALGSLSEISQRQLELATQAANGTYSRAQRQALNREASKLTSEFNRIVATTTFNGVALFDPQNGSLAVQAGYGGSGVLNVSFTEKISRTVGTGSGTISATNQINAASTVVADFNGDGIVDAISGNGIASSIMIAIGNGDGTFKAATTLGSGYTTLSTLTAGDINNDGRQDISFLSTSGNMMAFLGNGDGTFAVGAIAPLLNASNVYFQDLNNDGNLDIVTGTAFGNDVVFMGNGNGSFGAARTLSVMGDSDIFGDFNGDGKLDIVQFGFHSNQLGILFGNGDGTFRATVSIESNRSSVIAGDFNADGALDLVTTTYAGQQLTILLGTGSGTFQSDSVIASAGTQRVAGEDLNGDGKTDLIFSSPFATTPLMAMFGNGDGSFTAQFAATIPVTSTSPGIVLTDLNRDGVIDFIAGTGQVFTQNTRQTVDIAEVNLTTVAGARSALETVTRNLDRIQSQLSGLGATTSRFATAVSVLQVAQESYKAAESRITDVDIASEAGRSSFLAILQQAGSAVLAQANQEPALALRLLQG